MWLWLLACSSDEVLTERLNAERQDLTVLVQDECTAEESAPVEIVLLSAIGGLEVGTATITPGCAPLGSDHDLTVTITEDDYVEVVDEARVTAISEAVSDLDGDGEDEARDRATYILPRNPFEPGNFAITLRSRGAVGEMREDRWRVSLFAYYTEEDGGGGLFGAFMR